MAQWEKDDFRTEVLYSDRPQVGMMSWVFIGAVFAFFLCAVIWAKNSELEEVTRGEGRIVPSGRIQVVQSLEGGIVEAIHVAVGDRVEQGQLLLNIDDTNFSASVEEIEARQKALNGKITRLEAELAGQSSVDFSDELKENAPGVVASETRLFNLRRSSLGNEISVLSARKVQREQEYQELLSSQRQLRDELGLVREELRINERVSDLVAESELLRLRREVTRITGELDGIESSLGRAQAAVREATSLISKERSAFREEAQAELTQAEADLSVIMAGSKAADDRVDRAGLKSPVDGIINTIHVNTLGGVVQPGSDLVEIVPYSGTIQIEAKIRPQDIAFLSPNQKARVKITAYDYSIYGGLEGYVERIGADSLTDEVTGETYFPIDILADATEFKDGDKTLSVTPGMVASVDIITGKKSILQYILKPINKARYEGLRER